MRLLVGGALLSWTAGGFTSEQRQPRRRPRNSARRALFRDEAEAEFECFRVGDEARHAAAVSNDSSSGGSAVAVPLFR